jgi:hypothetical protein
VGNGEIFALYHNETLGYDHNRLYYDIEKKRKQGTIFLTPQQYKDVQERVKQDRAAKKI